MEGGGGLISHKHRNYSGKHQHLFTTSTTIAVIGQGDHMVQGQSKWPRTLICIPNPPDTAITDSAEGEQKVPKWENVSVHPLRCLPVARDHGAERQNGEM